MGNTEQSLRSHRKDEHLEIAQKAYEGDHFNDFNNVHLIRPTLPETALADVDISTTLFGKKLAAPLYINAMTGGSRWAKTINEALARIAKEVNIGMATGSATILNEEPEQLSSFAVVREINEAGLIMANIGPDTPLAVAQKVIASLKADALQIHVNAVQETVMPEGDRSFVWLDKIAELVKGVKIPIIVKEVGFGFDEESIDKLIKIGVKFIDVAGAGGTNFVTIENARRQDSDMSYLSDIGLSTIKSLINAQNKDVTILGSGGVNNPLDALKCLSLNAQAVGISGLLLHKLIGGGSDETIVFLKDFIYQLKQLFALYGIKKVDEAPKLKKLYEEPLLTYIEQKNKGFNQ